VCLVGGLVCVVERVQYYYRGFHRQFLGVVKCYRGLIANFRTPVTIQQGGLYPY
jgi:hypothetical protein